jgi:hypothetical protein
MSTLLTVIYLLNVLDNIKRTYLIKPFIHQDFANVESLWVKKKTGTKIFFFLENVLS